MSLGHPVFTLHIYTHTYTTYIHTKCIHSHIRFRVYTLYKCIYTSNQHLHTRSCVYTCRVVYTHSCKYTYIQRYQSFAVIAHVCACSFSQQALYIARALYTHEYKYTLIIKSIHVYECCISQQALYERWGAGVETQKNVRGEIGGWGRVPFNETYAPSLSTIYDGAQVS